MHYCVVLLCEVYSRTSTSGHLFTTATFSCPGRQSKHYPPPPSPDPADSPYITSCLKPSTNATSPKRQRSVFFSDWRKSQEYSRNLNCMTRWWFTRQSHFDCAPFKHTAAVSINSPATILIALRTWHVFSSWHFDSKHYLIFLCVCILSRYIIYVGYPDG